MPKLPSELAVFDHYGCDIGSEDPSASQVQGHCPFCHADKRRFYINPKTTQWDCKICGRDGNQQSFLSQFVSHCLDRTTREHYDELAEDRKGIPWGMVKEHNIGFDDYLDRWVIPAYARRNSILNIYTWRPGHAIMATAGLPLCIWRLNKMKTTGPVILCEGAWDAMALERLRRRCKVKASIISSPGCQVFKAEWHKHFVNRDLYIYYDNDSKAQEGAETVIKRVKGHAKTGHILQWPADEYVDGWDVRDYVHRYWDEEDYEPEDLWKELRTLSLRVLPKPANEGSEEEAEEAEEEASVESNGKPKVPPIKLKRTSFKSVIRDVKSRLELTKQMEDGLALMCATVLSVHTVGDPVWLFIVGPPGCGKTLLLKSFSKIPYCVYKSSITPKSLVSGFSQGSESDPSLLRVLQGKVLILKDYTEIMTGMSQEHREEMYGTFRGAFDGSVEKSFGNGITRSYGNTWFPYLAGVTDIIHGDDRASLGERFLKYQFCDGNNFDPTDQIESALMGITDRLERENFLCDVIGSFMLHFSKDIKLPPLPAWFRKRLNALCQVVGFLRMTIPIVGRDGRLGYRPAVEVGTRLALQLSKLAQCLTLVYGKTKIDQQVYNLVEQVGLDTGIGWTLDVFLTLTEGSLNNKPILKEEISRLAKINSGTLNPCLSNMKIAGIIETKKAKGKNGVGQPAYGWVLTEPMKRLWKTAGCKAEGRLRPVKPPPGKKRVRVRKKANTPTTRPKRK